MPKQALGQFAQWVNEEWKERKLSTREAVRVTGVSHSIFADVLNGSMPSLDTCVALAKLLGDVPPEDVLRRAGLLPRPPNWTPKADELLGLAAALPEADQDELIAMARLKLERLRKEKRGR